MSCSSTTRCLPALAALLWIGSSIAAAQTFPAAEDLPSNPALPDPLKMFDGTPENLELEPAVANWLVKTVWEDDKVQNGFPPAVQHWINVFDEEMTRLSDEIGGEKKKPAAIAEKAGE